MGTARTQVALGTVLFLFLCLPYLSIANEIYHPNDLFSINCGSSNNFSFDGRNWTGDNTLKLLLEKHDEPSSSAPSLTPSTIQGPYTSARLSYSQFTYSFPVTPGQKFLRLFFYPTSYQNFDPTKAYFAVKSGEYTLLKDFNATLNAEAEDNPQGTFFREFCINVEAGQRLNITFIPTTTYYAFINGIEIVSMPTYLYYTKPDDLELRLIGTNAQYTIENYTALETNYNLNVGGKTVSPFEDTGMLRSWEGDDSYVDSTSSLAVDYGGKTKLRFTQIPEYTAPDEIYRTIRNMGGNATLNKNYNLTWELPVDSGFNYMLRLHFCELDPRVESLGERRFYIFIQDQVVDDNADVLKWTNEQKGVPVVKDYVVMIQGNQKNTKLSIKLHPHPKSARADAYLNGIQLFKINDSQGNLAGPNPDPRSQTPPQVPLQTSENKGTTNTLAIVAGAVSGVVLFSVIVVVVFLLIKRGKKNDSDTSKHKDRTSRGGGSSSLPTNLCRHFSIEEIKTATNNFDELFVVGVGGFGNVYKGYIDDSSTRVAIKRLKPGSQQGAHEFLNEIDMLSKLRHLHLVSLIGYCCDNNEMILVYDFMPRGSLHDHLYNNTESENPSLSWKQRLHVCIGAAKGLHYLHTGAKHMIIHRDVKSTNILLDEKWVAKVSDFGLSRIGPTGKSMTHVSTVVKGSVGYLDPEYYKRQRLTEKSDVYSFGVVLLEVLCGRPPLLRSAEKTQVSLVDWAKKCYEMGSLGEIVDHALKGQIAPQCLSKFGEIAVSCLLDDGGQRPSMNDVVWGLEFVLQLQENAVGVGGAVVVEGVRNDEDSDYDMFSSRTSGMADNNSKSSGVSMTSSGDHSYGMSKES